LLACPDIKDEKYGKLRTTAEALSQAVKKAVIAEQHSELYKDSHGLSVYLPTSRPNPEKYGYTGTKWAKDTSWDEMLISNQPVTMGFRSPTDISWSFTPPPLFNKTRVLSNQKEG
jgi:hypothetical protein